LDRWIRRFQAADKNTRLESLLEASKRLPELPDALRADRDRESHRVTECQTPVFLWIERQDDRLRLFADVPRESPTVRGFVALLVSMLDGQPPSTAAALPVDLLHALRLDEALGMMRTQGLTAIVQRIKRAAAEAAGPSAS
jgi:cysteine desulfuration protein SufE